MALVPLAAVVFGYSWWLGCLVTGVRQLFARPRRYGLVTLGIGAFQFAAGPLAMQLLMRARGIEWGS
jgi:hypothetical protein